MDNLLNDLNDEQLESVVTVEQPLRIIAGAGSGKTRVITVKIAHLIKDLNYTPYKILAITFTNKAANEMKERVDKFYTGVKKPFISTFHKLCLRILSEDCEKINIKKNFSIIAGSEQRTLVKKIFNSLNIADNKGKEVDKAISKISKWKSEFNSWQDLSDSVKTSVDMNHLKVYRDYERKLMEENYLDFDDLLLKTYNLFNEHPDIRKKWENRFEYILVDEFQDTNYIQFSIVKMLLGERACLTVVGDPDQNIYSWRGAKIDIILNFNKNFKNSKTIYLNQNYRSTKSILNLANHFIANNKIREEKNIISNNIDGNKVEIKEYASRVNEASDIALKIKQMVSTGDFKYSDFFIMYRINAWSQQFEQELGNKKIPYRLVGGFKFIDRKEIKDITSILKMIAIKDSISSERALLLIPKVGKVTLSKLFTKANDMGLNLVDFITKYIEEVSKISNNVFDLCSFIKEAISMYEENFDVLEIAKFLISKFNFMDQFDKKDKQDEEKRQNVEAYLDQMKNFDKAYKEDVEEKGNKLDIFLQNILLQSPDDNEIKADAVTLLTIHSSKGLENKVVFITGLNEGIFPSRMSYYSMEQLEEERRAFYVAITRAQEVLQISYVTGDYSFITNSELCISKFILELNPQFYNLEKNIYIHHDGVRISRNVTEELKSKKSIKKVELMLKIKDNVEHDIFGKGRIIKISDNNVVVAFENPKYNVKNIPISSADKVLTNLSI